MLDQRDALRNIHTFPQLIKFLRDELEWPIDSDDFEELTFNYTPEELGIDTASAAKIQEIKRLRPLSASQPWGIFFVKFEPKRLPVVALRRVLSRVVLKKRASANSAERAAWQADDLLFISNYGQGDERQISFAHFSTHEEKGDLPTLMVLGWDSGDTALHLDDVADKLTTRLSWPERTEDVAHWRERWRSAFTLRHREVITTSKALAERLADLAQSIRKRVNAVLKIESDKGELRKLHVAFREVLIHDLSEDDFADMYAQTIAYGLLTARVSRPSGLVAENLRDMVPVTNPFLKDLLGSFLAVGGRKGKVDFDELGVSDVVQLLRDADMEAVLRDFGDRNPEEDPAIHFYELFLKEYDPKKRMQRGVFYTPRPVVSYIVRSVHELLQTEFGLKEGLASTITWREMAQRHKDLNVPDGVALESAFVQILDPAAGTATFLVEAIDVIYRTLRTHWKERRLSEAQRQAEWNEYVPKHLLPRLHGYELMMAPYAIAHMKVGLKLYETGYRFGSNERVRIYLTNALEPASDQKKQREFEEWVPALAHEAQAANGVKKDQLFTVVMGNPPYSLMSANLGNEQRRLIDPYRLVDGIKIKERGALQLEKNLQDDYVKFIRFAEATCERSPLSVMGFITNHTYIENPTLRGLRRSLMGTFNVIWILDLHGNSKRKERCPLPVQDQNVFDIQQGVAIALMARGQDRTQPEVWWGEVWGPRNDKYEFLGRENFRHLSAIPASPDRPLYVFIRQDDDLRKEFDVGLPLDRIFLAYSTGVATARDDLTVHFTRADLHATVLELSLLPPEKARMRFGLGPDTNDWKVNLAIEDVKRTGCNEDRERKYQYRPFDQRYTYYTGKPRGFLCNPRWPVMQHLIAGTNVALCSVKSVETGHEYAHAFVTRDIADHHSVSIKEVNYVFPALAYPEADVNEQRGLFLERGLPTPNISPECLSLFRERLGLTVVPNASGFAGRAVAATDIISYLYCILHSSTYRNRYAAFLRKQSARIPIPQNRTLFETAVQLGGELVALHLLEAPQIDKLIATYTGSPNPEVERVSYLCDTVWLNKAQSDGFRGLPEAVWNFHIGGYRVCEKWLKDRKGRSLSQNDITHYQKIVVALSETIRIMGEIDEVIEAHGGWPSAFVSGDGTVAAESSSKV